MADRVRKPREERVLMVAIRVLVAAVFLCSMWAAGLQEGWRLVLQLLGTAVVLAGQGWLARNDWAGTFSWVDDDGDGGSGPGPAVPGSPGTP